MYHSVTYAQQRKARNTAIIVAASIAVAIILAVVIWFAVANSLKAESASSIRQAIITTAQQCAAIEGAYPSTLDYLEDNYGLAINHDDYVITYEVFSSNVQPTVRVEPK